MSLASRRRVEAGEKEKESARGAFSLFPSSPGESFGEIFAALRMRKRVKVGLSVISHITCKHLHAVPRTRSPKATAKLI